MRIDVQFNPAWRRSLAPDDRRLWFFRAVALRIEIHTNPLWQFEIYHRRLLLTLGASGIVLWLTAATGLWIFLQRNPHNQVRWADVLTLPVDRAGFSRKRGNTAILTGIEQFRDKAYSDAFFSLRAGLARSPANAPGRILLAQLYAGVDSTRTLTLLEDGALLTPGDLPLLRTLFGYYSFYKVRARALQHADAMLAASGAQALPADARVFVSATRVSLLLELERVPEALAQLAAISPRPALPAVDYALRLLEVDTLLRAGRPLDARKLLDQYQPTGPLDADSLYRAGEVAVALDDVTALQSVLRRLKALAPDSTAPWLYAFGAWHRLKRPMLRDAVEKEYFAAFGSSDAALQAFAALLVNLDLPEVIQHVQNAAQAARLSAFAFQVHLTEVALRRGDYERATRQLREWENTVVTVKGEQKFYPEFIKLLTRAAFVGGEQPVSALVNHFNGSRGQTQLPICVLALTVLDRAGNLAAEEQVLHAALQFYPFSDPLIAAQKKLSTKLAANATAAAKASQSAAPTVTPMPPTAAVALKLIDDLLQSDSLTAARDQMRLIRAARPDWLAAAEPELSLRELQLAFSAQDLITSRILLRQYLDHFHEEIDGLRLTRLAAGFSAEKHLDAARLLHDEVLARFAYNLRVATALGKLNLPDDLATYLATSAGTLGALDQWLDMNRYAQVERLLADVRNKPPVWFEATQPELKVREVRLRFALDQSPAAMAVFKEIVLRPGASRSAAFRLVREMAARGEQTHAAVLAAEIVRLLPREPAAAKLLKEVQAPHPAG